MNYKKEKLKKEIIIMAAVFVISLLALFILPHFIVGQEWKGQHMDTRIIVDEDGNEIEVNEPGMIEYHIEYSPLEQKLISATELCTYIVPISAVVLIVLVIKYIIQSKTYKSGSLG